MRANTAPSTAFSPVTVGATLANQVARTEPAPQIYQDQRTDEEGDRNGGGKKQKSDFDHQDASLGKDEVEGLNGIVSDKPVHPDRQGRAGLVFQCFAKYIM